MAQGPGLPRAPRDDSGLTPSRTEQGVNTAPTLSAADEIAQLRAENERLKKLLDQQGKLVMPGPIGGLRGSKIHYDKYPFSGARLGGITGKALKAGTIKQTTDFPYLPQATTDMDQLEADFMRWGYCMVKDAISPAQIQAQLDRLLDQAEAERAAKVANMSHGDCAQLIGNILPKGQVFRDILAFEESACQQGPLIEKLMGKILGKGFYLGTAHGSIVHQGGGLQDMHQDQGYVPLPHPPYPLAVLIIWLFSDFSLENGGTYLVPGTHIDEQGANHVRPEVEYEKLVKSEPGLCALKAPAGQCFIMDARLLHSGGKRTAAGTRYGLRNLYIRGHMRQQENQFLGCSDEVLEKCSKKLLGYMGFKPYLGLGMVNGNGFDPAPRKVPVCELSMSRPEDFAQDFDIKHSRAAKMAQDAGSKHMEYVGPRAKL